MSDNSERTKHAETIIRNHVIWSMGAGMIPILVADVFAVCLAWVKGDIDAC